MGWTLDKMIRQTARLAKVQDDLFTDGNSITGTYLTDSDAVAIKQSFTDSINSCIRGLSKEKGLSVYSQVVKGDSIDTSTLDRTFIGVKAITSENDNTIRFVQKPQGIINLPTMTDTDSSTIEYYYVPDELVNLTDETELQDGLCDHMVFCHFAAYDYLANKGDEQSFNRAQVQLGLYQDKYDQVNGAYSLCTEIEEAW